MKGTKWRRPALWMASLLATAGCASENAETQPIEVPPWLTDAGTTDAASDAVGVDLGANATAPVDEQFFASWQVSTVENQDPSPFGGGAWSEQRTTSLGLVRVVWQGDTGVRQLQLCALHTNPAFGSQLTYGAGFVNAVPVVSAPLHRAGDQWTQDAVTLQLGLTQDFVGPMPGLGEHQAAGVTDADQDGKPGVTVDMSHTILGSQQLYVVQREVAQWKGTRDAEGRIQAEPQADRQQSTVGASLDLLVMNTNSRPAAGKPAETLLWVPVAKGLDCKALIGQTAKLFGDAWPPGP